MDVNARREAAEALRAIKRGGEGWFSLSKAVMGRPAPRDEVVSRLADLIDPGEDTTVSAYDLLPEEDRETLRWVKGSGGIDAVQKEVSNYAALCRSIQDADNRRAELCSALGIDPDTGWSDAMAEMMRRLMPEGMGWPRFEDGEPVRIGDDFEDLGQVAGIKIGAGGVTIEGTAGNSDLFITSDERVKRPAPKVLDADGVEIRAGDEVWSTNGEFDGKRIVKSVHHDSDEPPYALFEEWHAPWSCLCCYLTHQRPAVLAADGETLEKGQTVYLPDGTPLHVTGIGDMTEGHQTVFGKAGNDITDGEWDAVLLTHQRLVLDADGVPIHEGDTVYGTETGNELVVDAFVEDGSHGPYTVDCHFAVGGEHNYYRPDKLSHTKPEPSDTWERIEFDLRKGYIEYWGCSGCSCSDCPSAVDGKRPMDLFDASCSEAMHKDIVRRCKALAGVSE